MVGGQGPWAAVPIPILYHLHTLSTYYGPGIQTQQNVCSREDGC